MKQGISTWVHHLIDAMNNGRLLVPDSDPHKKRDTIERTKQDTLWFSKLPVFVIQTDGRDLFNRVLIQHAKSVGVKLPYPNMLLEVAVTGMRDEVTGERELTDRWVIHAMGGADTKIWLRVFTTDHDPAEWAYGYGDALIDPAHPDCIYDYIPPKRLPPKFEREANGIVSDSVGMLMSFLGLLNTPAVETETHEAPAKLNKARAKRKRAAIPTYTAVTLRLPRRAHGEREGTEHHGRASPRTHWRAGHKREYQPGKYASIPPTLVAYSGEGEPPPPKYNVIIDRTPS